MRYLIFFSLIHFIAITSKAQKDLNLGEVRFDTAFNCNDSLDRKFSERLFNIPNICDSKNDIEVRLNGISRPGSTREFIIFSYKDRKWDAKKYTRSAGMLGPQQTIVSFKLTEWDSVAVEQVCTYLLNHLIENRIFRLPDQSELMPKEYKTHGAFLTLSYKANEMFRTYSFLHPDSYLKENPNNQDYIYFKEIVKTLRDIFQ